MDPSEDVRTRWTVGVREAAARAYAAGHGSDPPEPRATRWRLDPRTALSAIAAIALLAAVAWWGLRGEPAAPLVGEASASPGESATPTGSDARAATVVVHVSGAVAEPGLVTVPSDARVVDAVLAAGGLGRKADESSVNLARPVVDGEHIIVGAVVEEGATGGGAGAAAAGAAAGARVNLNSADAAALEALPGIGPVLAARIVADREAHGPFLTLEDLARVSGVGPAVVASLEEVATT
ncbi:ComEA family DNA-binding protein [Demequina mangrovi]|uniref:Competence protein ComEA n=1 Tax=Demequina mangrovi TaxID=1043493 RepID=A0A1H6V3H4_9MICO|nr:ComEA family DNA-binding protein [Demequina mangrovi]SEI96377.1 competence protein ComEA [Demequina mangrovi]